MDRIVDIASRSVVLDESSISFELFSLKDDLFLWIVFNSLDQDTRKVLLGPDYLPVLKDFLDQYL